MLKVFVSTGFLAITSILAAAPSAWAGDPKPAMISVPDIHCAGCAKKVTTHLTAVAGVEKAEVDLNAKTFKIVAKQKATISPKALWEAVEKAGYTPNKLECPSGTFTAKPQS